MHGNQVTTLLLLGLFLANTWPKASVKLLILAVLGTKVNTCACLHGIPFLENVNSRGTIGLGLTNKRNAGVQLEMRTSFCAIS